MKSITKLCPLNEVCQISNGYAFKSESFLESGVPLLRISNINDEKVTFKDNTVYLDKSNLDKYKNFIVRKGDVVVALSGATTGKYGIYQSDIPCLLNQRIGIIRNESSTVLDSKYFYFYLGTLKSEILRKAQGAAQPNISTKDLGKMCIPLPPLAEQKQIAAILDAADSLRQKDQQLVEHYTALSQSLFLEMFGDPVINPNNWDIVLLDEIAEIISGVTKGRKLNGAETFDIPYMRVANVQDGHLNLNEIKHIPGTESDLEKYALKQGDVLLTEGGDPDKLGRGAVWNNEIENCIHQNHIFRVRLTCKASTPLFLSKLCGSEYGKRYFLKSSKQTTGIASINKTQLKRFPVLRPPIELQNQFAERVAIIEKQKQQAQANLKKSEALFNSLLQRAFTGELTADKAA